MCQAESDARPHGGRATLASSFAISTILIIILTLAVAGLCSSRRVQETRPRRVNPPAPEERASTNRKEPAAPAVLENVSMPSRGAFNSRSPDVPAHSFTVQLGAFLHADNAERLATLLKSRGYDPDVSIKSDSQRREWHLVRVGAHSDRRSAQVAAREIERKLKMKAIVRPAGSL